MFKSSLKSIEVLSSREQVQIKSQILLKHVSSHKEVLCTRTIIWIIIGNSDVKTFFLHMCQVHFDLKSS